MITCHNGATGSGKSHNVMKYELLPALKAGRSVFTNVDGVASCIPAIADYCNRSESEIKNLLTIFPPDGIIVAAGVEYSIRRNLHELVIRGDDEKKGDLIIIDEAASPLIFNKSLRSKRTGISDDVVRFFQMHRHYGVDIVLLAQHPAHLFPDLRQLVHSFVVYVKLNGIKKNTYRVEHWELGYSPGSGGMKVRQGFEKYDKRVFSCYQSVTVGDASKDGTNDSRFSIFKSAPFRLLIIAVCALFFIVPYLVTSFSDGSFFGSKSEPETAIFASSSSVVSSGSSVLVKSAVKSPVVSVSPLADSFLSYLSEFRLRLDAIVTHKNHPQIIFGLYNSSGHLVDQVSSDALATFGAVFSPFWYDSHFVSFSFGSRNFVVFSWFKKKDTFSSSKSDPSVKSSSVVANAHKSFF